ncbi:hypothetical protein [Pseudomonas sp. SWRI179]|uniref:hypothetical protein n=1 Tax=Pseudomonas sp. SWRI179 TaxID=2745497 RepID=UPI0016479A0B|nr:hypothetical protein [Pseudomonas sp. SWRI179]MBC3383419.1 hypothetical protein [Pseudomonas sp. SWRI179]MBC3383476.1 hypothetical protein [Pseudomonas sp. SWRI179]
MQVTCTKFEAASRQLNEAISLFFADHDPLAVRTLVAASHGLLADLVEHKQPDGSWRSHLVESSGLSRKEALAAINSVQNFLKHADRDPNAHLNFDEEENDHIIFIATLECGELGGPLTTAMQAFQVWYLASYPDKIGAETVLVKKSRSAFPGMDKLAREERLDAGLNFLASAITKYGDSSIRKKKPLA